MRGENRLRLYVCVQYVKNNFQPCKRQFKRVLSGTENETALKHTLRTCELIISANWAASGEPRLSDVRKPAEADPRCRLGT
jgi:hypothetical protein